METDIYTKIDKSRASLILGAYGDALGAPVEFLKQNEIISKYGDSPNEIKGIQRLAEAYGKEGAITDDTQMTLFAADGLLSAHKRGVERGILGEYWTYTAMSYLKWLETQNESNQNYTNLEWGSRELFELIKSQGRRGPGTTCLSALVALPKPVAPAHNDSKGCGTVMRVAPVGIFFGSRVRDLSKESLQNIYDEGVKDAAITHGNEVAHHASGLVAVIIALTLQGTVLNDAITTAIKYFGTRDVSDIINEAIRLADQPASVNSLQSLGQGWVAEEALAIAIYCALLCVKGELSVENTLRLAVNHDGDSDSTAAIAGNLIGISLGTKHIPQSFIESDTEVSSLMELLRRYGENLVKTTI